MSIDFYLKQNDTGPSVSATLTDENGSAVNLTGATVRFHGRKPGGTVINELATIVTAASGVVSYDWASGDTDEAGMLLFEFQVTYADNSVETFPNGGYFTISITEELA